MLPGTALLVQALGVANRSAQRLPSPLPHHFTPLARFICTPAESQEGHATSTQSPVKQVLRASHAAEVAATAYFDGQGLTGRVTARPRVDISYFRDKERERLKAVEHLLPKHRTRPALLLGALRLGSAALGVLAAAAPQRINMAVSGALQEALAEHFNDQLRSLLGDDEDWEFGQQHGHQNIPEDVRSMVKELRDAERAPDGAPLPPSIMILRPGADVGLEDAVGAVVKTGVQLALSVASRS